MANHIGNSGIVKISTNTVAEVISFSLSENVNTADDFVLGDTWQTHTAGTKSWSGSVQCYWDETDTNGQEAMTVGASVELHLIPEGSGTGNIDFNGTATIMTIERSVQNDNIVTATFTFKGDGTLTASVLA